MTQTTALNLINPVRMLKVQEFRDIAELYLKSVYVPK